MMKEMDVSSHKGKYSGHLQLSVYISRENFGVRRVRFKIYMKTNILLTVIRLLFS